MNRSYLELMRLESFMDRYNYLKLSGRVGLSTFGHDRYLNQILYKSKEWSIIRPKIIVRDEGRDLGIVDREIFGRIIVHHINPITLEQIEDHDPIVFDPENLICVSDNTHLAIHYGSEDLLPQLPKERKPNDTCPWL